MKFKSPSLPELHAFLAVCQLGSFSRAAVVLFVTQAAVSRAVQRLEQHLQCNLFDRTAAGVTPTARGRAFQELVEGHVTGLEQAMVIFTNGQLSTKISKSKLRLRVVPTLATRWLMPRLAQFQSANPDLAVELRQFHHDENFSLDDVDVWIDIKRPKALPRGFKSEYLLGKEIAPVCIPAIAKRLKTVDDFQAETLLHHTNFPDNWAVWLRGAGLRQAQPILGAGFDLGSNLIVAACAGAETIVAYNSSFEAGCIDTLISAAPDLSEALLAIKSKLCDALPIVRQNVYHPAFGGSFDLKCLAGQRQRVFGVKGVGIKTHGCILSTGWNP